MLSSRAVLSAARCADSARAALLASISSCQFLLYVLHRLLKMMTSTKLAICRP